MSASLSPTHRAMNSLQFFLVFIVLKTCLILGSGENLSFVLYYEFCYIRVDNALASMGSDTHTMVEDGGW